MSLTDAESASPSTARVPPLSRVALLAVFALHAVLLWHFVVPDELWSSRPLLDYGLHPRQVEKGLEAFAAAGRLWAYDPLDLAGRYTGLATDPGSRGVVLLVVALARLGVEPALALNAVVVVLHAAVPVVGWRAARLVGLTHAEGVVAVLSIVLIWFFDSLVHWQWFTGELGWSMASLAAVLALAGLAAMAAGRSPADFALGTVVVAVAQPWALIPLLAAALPFVATPGARARRTRAALVLAVVVVAGATVAVTAGPGRAMPGTSPVDALAPTPDFLVYDLLDLLRDPSSTGSPVRTALRTLVVAAAAWGVARAGRRRLVDQSPLVVGGFTALVLAYGGGSLPWVRSGEPYAHVATAALSCSILAAPVLVALLRPAALRALDRRGRVFGVLLLVIVVPRLIGTALQYLPALLPEPVRYWKVELNSSSLVGLNEPKPTAMRYRVAPARYDEIATKLAELHGGRGRVFVSEWALAEYLLLRTRLPVVGGPVGRLPHGNDAHLLAGDAALRTRGPALAAHLERYAVGLVVLSGERGALDHRPDVLDLAFEGSGFRVHRVRAEPSVVGEGDARVTSLGLDSIRVSARAGESVMLRFHYVEGLDCRPACRVERTPEGFLRVVDSPESFEIFLPGKT